MDGQKFLFLLYEIIKNSSIISLKFQQSRVHNYHLTMLGYGTNENFKESNITVYHRLKIPGRRLFESYYQIWPYSYTEGYV